MRGSGLGLRGSGLGLRGSGVQGLRLSDQVQHNSTLEDLDAEVVPQASDSYCKHTGLGCWFEVLG